MMSVVYWLDSITARPLLGIGSAANPPQGCASTVLPITTAV
jgi:hypothetical protein